MDGNIAAGAVTSPGWNAPSGPISELPPPLAVRLQWPRILAINSLPLPANDCC